MPSNKLGECTFLGLGIEIECTNSYNYYHLNQPGVLNAEISKYQSVE